MVVWTKKAEGQLTKDFYNTGKRDNEVVFFFKDDIMEKLRQIYKVKDFSGKNFNRKC